MRDAMILAAVIALAVVGVCAPRIAHVAARGRAEAPRAEYAGTTRPDGADELGKLIADLIHTPRP